RHGEVKWFATPRRLAVYVTGVADQQPDQQIKRQGPALANAFGPDGQPTKAALGFAASCGVSVDQLLQVDGPKGKVLQFEGSRQGSATTALLPGIVTTALDNLPIARRMRWGAGSQEFVRPVHWVVMLFGSSVVDAEILGIRAGKQTQGHRFHGPKQLAVTNPARYAQLLLDKAHVVADVSARRERIRAEVNTAADAIG